MKRAYNKQASYWHLKVGDLVLRRTTAIGKAHTEGKLTTNWEGPYIIQEEIVPDSYKLSKMDGKILASSWNPSVLK